MKYNILYEITNIVNGKKYAGIHVQTLPPNEFDGYLGSGNLIKRAISKYGVDSFTRVTLGEYDTYDQAREAEMEYVNLDYVSRDDTYNLSIGGTGGNTIPNISKEQKEAMRIKRYATRVKNGKELSDESRKLLSDVAKKRAEDMPHLLPNNKGRKHSGKALENMREASAAKKGKFIWINNGKTERMHDKLTDIPEGYSKGGLKKSFWITNGEESKLVVLGSEIGDGWYAGRQMAKSNKQYTDNMIGTKRYTNGVVNIRLKDNDPVPNGFYKGMAKRETKRMWITDGVSSKSVPINSEINRGWKRGRTL